MPAISLRPRGGVAPVGDTLGDLTGAPPRDYNPASGGVPGVTSPISTLTGNLGNLGNIIGSLTGSSSAALRGQYPGEYFGALGTLLGNVGRRAGGDISDLLPELQQNSAEAAVAGGVSGSGAENTKLLRDMGLTRYGVEEQALKDLGMIQSELPLVHPFDPNDVIRQQADAQERADIYRAAPSPEAAYRRANAATGGGGGGGGTPGVRYGGAGGGVGTVDDALRRRGASMAPVIARGTNPWAGVTPGAAPYGTMPGVGPENFDPMWDTNPSEFDPMWDSNPLAGNFGGSAEYGGGAPWQGWTSPWGDQSPSTNLNFDLSSGLDVYGPGGGGGFAGSLDYGGGAGYYNDYSGGGDYYDEES